MNSVMVLLRQPKSGLCAWVSVKTYLVKNQRGYALSVLKEMSFLSFFSLVSGIHWQAIAKESRMVQSVGGAMWELQCVRVAVSGSPSL